MLNNNSTIFGHVDIVAFHNENIQLTEKLKLKITDNLISLFTELLTRYSKETIGLFENSEEYLITFQCYKWKLKFENYKNFQFFRCFLAEREEQF